MASPRKHYRVPIYANAPYTDVEVGVLVEKFIKSGDSYTFYVENKEHHGTLARIYSCVTLLEEVRSTEAYHHLFSELANQRFRLKLSTMSNEDVCVPADMLYFMTLPIIDHSPAAAAASVDMVSNMVLVKREPSDVVKLCISKANGWGLNPSSMVLSYELVGFYTGTPKVDDDVQISDEDMNFLGLLGARLVADGASAKEVFEIVGVGLEVAIKKQRRRGPNSPPGSAGHTLSTSPSGGRGSFFPPPTASSATPAGISLPLPEAAGISSSLSSPAGSPTRQVPLPKLQPVASSDSLPLPHFTHPESSPLVFGAPGLLRYGLSWLARRLLYPSPTAEHTPPSPDDVIEASYHHKH